MSDTVLAGLEPETTEYREHDGNGLYLRVKPNGNKSWVLRYRTPAGRWSWMGLGSYPSVTAAMARKKAAAMRETAYLGEDPVESRRARQKAEREAERNTFEHLAEEWYQARRKSWEDGTAKRIRGTLQLHVFSRVGKRRFDDISPMEWMELLREMEKKQIFEQMGNVRRYCKEIYDLARVTGRITHNPLDGLNRFLHKQPNENYAHVDIEDLPILLRAISAYPHAKDVRLGLRLLLLTASRPSEVREAAWSEFDLKGALWTVPAARMKKRREHLVPLSRQAIETLKELRELTGAYPLLLPGRNDRTVPRSNMVFSMALRRMGYEGRQTAHGFRHIASTILREQGFPRDHVEAQLSHVEGGISGVYNKATYLPQRREMMQWYADHIDALERGKIVTLPVSLRAR